MINRYTSYNLESLFTGPPPQPMSEQEREEWRRQSEKREQEEKVRATEEARLFDHIKRRLPAGITLHKSNQRHRWSGFSGKYYLRENGFAIQTNVDLLKLERSLVTRLPMTPPVESSDASCEPAS